MGDRADLASDAGIEPKDDAPLGPSAMVPAEGITLAPEVAAAIAEAFPSDDPVDDPEFDTVKHINTLFPNEQSLSKLEPFMAKLKARIRRIDHDIQSSVRGQSASDTSGQALKDAQVGMAELFSRIQDIRKKAEVSERMVQEITRDIRSLDHAKKHLTASITTLNHLKMLVGGVDSLQMLSDNGQYRDAANILSAMQNVLEHFERYREIPRIKELHERVDAIKLQLSQQINAEFRKAFRRPEPDRRACDPGRLAEGCAVVDVLDPEEQERFKSWFVNLQLRDYRDVFNINEDAAWVDKIDRRFAWLKRTLASYNENCSGIFPREWYLEEVITERFLEITREDLVEMIASRRLQLDVKLLLFALKKSTEFEQWLVLRFPSREYEEIEPEPERGGGGGGGGDAGVGGGGPADGDSIRSKYRRFQEERMRAAERERGGGQPQRRLKPNKFIGRVSKIFSGCMDVYISAQDKTLEGMLEAFVRTYKAEGLGGAADESDSGKTFDSSGDMFRFFRECIITCAQLNSKPAIFELYLLFKKYLGIYCERMLTANLPQSSSIASVILKDASVKLSPEEQFLTCCILNTAEYCMETTAQLEGKLKQKVPEEKTDEVDMTEEQDKFHEVISNAISLLVRALETQCEPSLTAMAKTKWDQIEEVGDTSLYVSQMGKNMATFVPFVRSSFSSDRKYFTNFCMKFVNSFIPRLMTYMYKCKVGLSHVGAEQLLLDMQSVRMLLLELPTIGSATARKPTSSYTRYVTKMTTKAEMILKVVMAPHEPAQLYVEDYVKLVGDEEGISTLQTILEMKGLKKAEQQPILDAYRQVAPAGAAEGERPSAKAAGGGAAKSGGLSAASSAGTKQRSSIRKLERLMKRFQ